MRHPMHTEDYFVHLRREAYERGRRDCFKAWEASKEGETPLKNNPHQNNHATDEREAWEEGWTDEQEELTAK